MRAELIAVLEHLQDMAAEELPELIGQLEQVKATAMMRMTMPADTRTEDRLIGVDEASRLSGLTKDRLYRKEFPFTRKEGHSRLFSYQGIQKYIKTRR